MKFFGAISAFFPNFAFPIQSSVSVAQLVEQLTLNQRVHGSSPCGDTGNQALRSASDWVLFNCCLVCSFFDCTANLFQIGPERKPRITLL
jgi:hypothetical protein